MMMHWFYGGMGWGGWTVMTLTMVVFWGLVIYAVIAITRAGGERRSGAPEDPMRILEQRFARGEIDEEEYLRRHDILDSALR